MTANRRRSPLGGFAAAFARLDTGSGGRLRIAERPYLRQLDVRAEPTARAAAEAAVGMALPATPNRINRAGVRTALWLGPDEWLVVGGDRDLPAVPESAGWGLVDVSAQRTAIVLSGPAVDLLAHGCALDLERMGPDWCAQTMLARAGVILWDSAADEICVLVRASFAAYLAGWLLDAATELIG